MTIADLCLLGMVLLIVASIVPAKIAGRRDFDNANPRDPAFYTPGFRARSWSAHLNGHESFPFFAAAVVLARMAYLGCYWANLPTLRSLVFAIGFVLNVWLFFLPIL
jgi:uncharacterized MAPEG superfamily protein